MVSSTDYGHPMRVFFLNIPILADWVDRRNKLGGILGYFLVIIFVQIWSLILYVILHYSAMFSAKSYDIHTF